jgi:hypothetical protein
MTGLPDGVESSTWKWAVMQLFLKGCLPKYCNTDERKEESYANKRASKEQEAWGFAHFAFFHKEPLNCIVARLARSIKKYVLKYITKGEYLFFTFYILYQIVQILFVLLLSAWTTCTQWETPCSAATCGSSSSCLRTTEAGGRVWADREEDDNNAPHAADAFALFRVHK